MTRLTPVSLAVVFLTLSTLICEPSIAGTFPETLIIPADGTPVTSSALEAGSTFIIEASGTYVYRSGPPNLADAEWFDPWGNPGVWQEEQEALPYCEDNHDLMVDGGFYDWLGTTDGTTWSPHTLSPDHLYRLEIVGEGTPVEFAICDTLYGDNSGSLTVTITLVDDIPTVSEWGMVTMMLLVLAAGTVVLMRRRVSRV